MFLVVRFDTAICPLAKISAHAGETGEGKQRVEEGGAAKRR